jgi:hypothetical protein
MNITPLRPNGPAYRSRGVLLSGDHRVLPSTGTPSVLTEVLVVLLSPSRQVTAKLLLAPVSAVILGSESHGTHAQSL